MAFIPVPRGVKICFPVVVGGQSVEFCVSVQKASGVVVPSTDFDAIEGAIEGSWGTTMKPLQSTEATMPGPIITDISSDGGEQQIYSFAQTGTAASAALPNNATVAMSFRTAKRGRSYRGRAYMTGVPLSAQDTPTDITTAYAEDLADAINGLMAAIAVENFFHIVASKQHNLVETNPAATNLVTAYVVDTHFDSQRRRLFGRGT